MDGYEPQENVHAGGWSGWELLVQWGTILVLVYVVVLIWNHFNKPSEETERQLEAMRQEWTKAAERRGEQDG